MRLFGLRRALIAFAAALLLGLLTAATAGASTWSWTVSMSGNDVLASGLPANPNGSGSASLTFDDSANRICGTFTWSNVQAPVVFGHIHQAEYGKPENLAVTVNLFGPVIAGAPSGVSGCAIVPGPEIDAMVRFPQEFEVVIHNKQYPWGPIRGQLGGGSLRCELALCPGP